MQGSYALRKTCRTFSIQIVDQVRPSLAPPLDSNPNPVSMEAMKTKTMVLTLALCFLAGTACFAANPHMGTWKLNEAKSKLAPGTGKNKTVVYQSAPLF